MAVTIIRLYTVVEKKTDRCGAHLHDVPPESGLGDWYGDATAEVAEHEHFERRVVHHVEEHSTADRHVALSHTKN